MLYAYCLMPDHLHFVCRPTVEGPMSDHGARGILPESTLDHIARFKSYTTTESWKCGLTGPLWQRSSYDMIVDEFGPIDEVCRYSLDNPVRKGLVQVWTDWPYAGVVDAW